MLKSTLQRFGEAGWRIQWIHFCGGQYVAVLYRADGWRSEFLKACTSYDQETTVKALTRSLDIAIQDGAENERRDEIRALLTPILKKNGTAVQDVGVSTTSAKTVLNGTADTPRKPAPETTRIPDTSSQANK